MVHRRILQAIDLYLHQCTKKTRLFDTDDIKFLKYGIRKDHSKWILVTPQGIELVNNKLNCSITIPTESCTAIKIILPKEMTQWRLKDRLPEERKYVIYNHQLDSLIKDPFGVITAFPHDPNPLFDDNASTISLSISTSTSKETHTDNSRISPNKKQTVNATTQTEWISVKLEYQNFVQNIRKAGQRLG